MERFVLTDPCDMLRPVYETRGRPIERWRPGRESSSACHIRRAPGTRGAGGIRCPHGARPRDRDSGAAHEPALRPTRVGDDGHGRRCRDGGAASRGARLRLGVVLRAHRHPGGGVDRARGPLLRPVLHARLLRRRDLTGRAAHPHGRAAVPPPARAPQATRHAGRAERRAGHRRDRGRFAPAGVRGAGPHLRGPGRAGRRRHPRPALPRGAGAPPPTTARTTTTRAS